MKLRMLAVGKPREHAQLEWMSDYARRVRAPFALELVWPKSMDALRHQANPANVVLDERGVDMTSAELAAFMAHERQAGIRQLDFCIGDAYGFAPADRDQARLVLALSRMTLPHRLAQLVLVEQLYRAYTILGGHPYHHE